MSEPTRVSTHERFAPCPWCGRRIRARIPAGGDGSASVYDRHNGTDGYWCVGSRRPADYEDAPAAKPSSEPR